MFVSKAKVAQGLRGWRTGCRPRCAIQWQFPSLVFVDNGRLLPALKARRTGKGVPLGFSIEKKQRIRNIVAPPGGFLLRQVQPAESRQDRKDDKRFGFRFPELLGLGDLIEVGAGDPSESRNLGIGQFAPGSILPDTLVKIVSAEQSAADHGVTTVSTTASKLVSENCGRASMARFHHVPCPGARRTIRPAADTAAI